LAGDLDQAPDRLIVAALAHLKLDRLEAAMLDMSAAEVARKLSVPTIASHIF
jgi:hypothetical protein